MPNISTSFLGGVTDFLSDVGGIAGDLLSAAGPIISPIVSQRQARQLQQEPVYLPGVSPAFGFPGFDIAPPGSTPITPRAANGGMRLPSTVEVPYETPSGMRRTAHYRNQGRPLLYSGDLAACKRVRKVGSKARRRSGGR